MFREAVAESEAVVQAGGLCFGRLFVGGMATQVAVRYLPNGEMEILRLPHDMPAYLLFGTDTQIFLDRDRKKPVLEEASSLYRLYRTWDPRTIARAVLEERVNEEDEDEGLRPSVTYDLRKAIEVDDSIASRIAKYIENPREVRFLIEEGRLREMTELDFSDARIELTLAFEYRIRVEE